MSRVLLPSMSPFFQSVISPEFKSHFCIITISAAEKESSELTSPKLFLTIPATSHISTVFSVPSAEVILTEYKPALSILAPLTEKLWLFVFGMAYH